MSYVCSLSHIDDELRIFRSCIRWMCVDQSDARRAIAFSSLFLLLGVFCPHCLQLHPLLRPYLSRI
ncbi:hypothetical protein GW17_00038703 [Ensete ventricosum]|nr:hypothetical protein GW17_00038703 [Ensete ventricosum]